MTRQCAKSLGKSLRGPELIGVVGREVARGVSEACEATRQNP